MKHFTCKSFLSGAATALAVALAVIIFAPQNAFAEAIEQHIENGYGGTQQWFNGNASGGGGDPIVLTENGTIKYLQIKANWFSGATYAAYIKSNVGGGGGDKFCIDDGSNTSINVGTSITGTSTYTFSFLDNININGGCNLLASDSTIEIHVDKVSGSNPENAPRVFGSTTYVSNRGGMSGSVGCCNELINGTAWYGLYTNSSVPPAVDTSTRIISFSPENGTTTNNPVEFNMHAYISPDDLGSILGIQITFHNIDQNVLLLGAFSPSDIYFLDRVEATSSGDFYYSTSTVLAEGNYRVEVKLERSYLGFQWPYNFFDLSISESHQFIVGQPTFIGNISQNSYTAYNNLLSSSTATSTSALAGSCNPLGDFSVVNCLAFFFIPDGGLVYDSLSNFRDNVSTHFPLGYITDFITILSSTTTIPLVVLDATVPASLPGGGSHIRLDLTRSLDFILYASTTSAGKSYGTSTATFYETTSYYWNLILYVLAGIYAIGRIVGSHLIPSVGRPFQEMSGQRGVSDESYRLKEELYRISKRK